MTKKYLAISGFSLLVMVVFTGKAVRQRTLRPVVQAQQQRREPPSIFRGANSNRVAIDRHWSNVPVRITAVNNLDAENWLQDLEIIIENRSNKPVYGAEIDVAFPDIPKIWKDGTPHGYAFPAYYGRWEFILHTDELAKEDDVPIRPGQRGVVKIHENMWKGLKEYLKAHDLSESILKRVVIDVLDISFGDGSGYQNRTRAIPRY
jgi:hypothetical protein